MLTLFLSFSLSLSTFDVYGVLCALVLHEEKNNWIYRLRGPFKFRAIVIMRFCITSFFVYSDRLFLYDLVYLSLPRYLSSLIFISTSLRSPSIISSIDIFVFNLFRTLLLCPLKSFWLSYSVSQSKFQSSRFFYPYSLSHSISLRPKHFLVVCHTPFLSPFLY